MLQFRSRHIAILVLLVTLLLIGLCLALRSCRQEGPPVSPEVTTTMTTETSETTTETSAATTSQTETTSTSTETTTTTTTTSTETTTAATTTTVKVTATTPVPTEPVTEAPTQTVTEAVPQETVPPTEAPTVPPTEAPTEPPTEAAPIAGPTYIGGILVVNKTYPLPSDYNPGLDATCKAQFDALAAAAAKEGLNIWLASGFRSYSRQATIYNNYLNWYGQEKTDTLSARPGHSEHQTGLAIDVNSITDAFANTPEAPWLTEHAHEFGFIIRYPKGKEHITGYKYEPWHIRYLGVETATAVYNSGLCLEEYLGITSCYAD